jgi:hypothetical protein
MVKPCWSREHWLTEKRRRQLMRRGIKRLLTE